MSVSKTVKQSISEHKSNKGKNVSKGFVGRKVSGSHNVSQGEAGSNKQYGRGSNVTKGVSEQHPFMPGELGHKAGSEHFPNAPVEKVFAGRRGKSLYKQSAPRTIDKVKVLEKKLEGKKF